MEVIWILLLSVCTEVSCVSQTVDEFNTREQCIVSQNQHESLPEDGSWRSIEFKCLPKGAKSI